MVGNCHPCPCPLYLHVNGDSAAFPNHTLLREDPAAASNAKKITGFTYGGCFFQVVKGKVGIAGSIFGATLNPEISPLYPGLSQGTLIPGTALCCVPHQIPELRFQPGREIASISLFGSIHTGMRASGSGPRVITGLILMKISVQEMVSARGFPEPSITRAGFSTFDRGPG